MKINRKNLLEALRAAGKVCEGGKTSMPILSCVLLDGENQRLEATNLEIGLLYPLEITDYVREMAVDKTPGDLLEGLTGPQMRALNEDYGIIEIPKGAKVAEIREAMTAACQAKDTETENWNEAFCLSCKDLTKILQTLDEEVVEIRPAQEDGESATMFMKAPRVHIGENFQGLGTISADEFPRMAEPEREYGTKVQVEMEDLENVAKASTAEEAGFKLRGIHFDFNEDPFIVATDGHRLHYSKLDNCTVAEGVKAFELATPSLKAIKAAGVVKTKEKIGEGDDAKEIERNVVNIDYDHEHKCIMVKGEKGTLYIRPMESKFPDWKAVLPKAEDQKTVTLEKAALERPLQQAMTMTNERYTGGLHVRFNGGVDVEFNNPDKGSYQKVSIPVKAKSYTDKEELQVGLNGRYLLDAMKPITSEDLTVRFIDESKPVCMGHERFEALIMPMRV